MALPLTNIYMSNVQNIIGDGGGDVGDTLLSENVNQFGFNSPDSFQMLHFWGKSSAERAASPIGYPLGAFRGYDHDWLTFKAGDAERVSIEDYYTDFIVRFYIGFAQPFLASKPFVNVYHSFQVEFSRINNFSQGGAVILNTTIATYPYLEASFSPANPPDGGAALAEGATFYIRVLHNGSEIRRWWIQGETAAVAALGGDDYIFPFTVPYDPYTYGVGIHNPTAIAADDGSVELYQVTIGVVSDTRIPGTVPCSVQVANNASFLQSSVITIDISYQANSTPGTAQVNGSAVFNFTSAQADKLAYGGTMYWRWNFNNTGYSSTQQTAISNVVPL